MINTMKHYYLINNTIKKGSEMPQKPCYKVLWDAEGDEIWNDWKDSIQPCEIDESELDKVRDYIYHLSPIAIGIISINNPIDITDIVEEKDGKIYFKQPTEKQVESGCEAIEFAKWLSKNNYLPFNGQFRRVVWESPKEYSKTKSAQELYEIFKNR